MTEPTTPQWAMVPETAVRLTETDLKVFIVLSAKASGRERIAWIAQGTIAEKIGMERKAVGRAIRRLEKEGWIESRGTVVVDRELGTWVKKYLIAPFPIRLSTPSDQPVGAVEVPSSQRETDPMSLLGGPDGTFGDPRWDPAVSHIQILSSSNPHSSEPLARNVENEELKPRSKRLDEKEGQCPLCPNCISAWHKQHLLEKEGA